MFDNILPITKFLLVATAVVTALPVFGLVKSFSSLMFCSVPYIMITEPTRLVTSFFLIPSLKSIISLLLTFHSLYEHSQGLEISYFSKKSQFYYFLFFNMSMIILFTFFFQDQKFWMFQPSFNILLSFTYSMVFWNNDIKYCGIIPIKCKYTCLLDLFFSFIFATKGYFIMQSGLLGLVSGYIYTCLATRSFGPVYGFLKHRVLGFKQPKYIWKTSKDLSGKVQKFKVENPEFGQKSEEKIKRYGFGGGIPLYPGWIDSLNYFRKKSANKIKISVSQDKSKPGKKLGTGEAISTYQTNVKKIATKSGITPSTERSEASKKIADIWANKY
ncbi:hypothetical protein QEN19_002157 [Hanseniaspora menglaensis]